MNERLVRMVVRKFASTSVQEEEDLVQEGMIAMLKAKKTFDTSVGVKFETYASLIIRNRLIDVLRRKKRQPLEESEEVVNSMVGKTLEDEIDLTEKRKILNRILKECTEIEEAIFNAYFQGFSYEEIASIFSVNTKKINNTIQKIKKRIKSEDEYR